MSKISCFGCHSGSMDHCDGCNLYEVSLHMAHYWNIIKKDIPAEKVTVHYTDTDLANPSYQCPVCHAFVCEESKYCDTCGQRLEK